MNNVGIIILAAGASTRLGKPKQTLVFEEHTLMERIISEVQATGVKNIVVIIGASADELSNYIPPSVDVVFNNNWHDGMGSGIKLGVEYLENNVSSLQSIIITVCDQPFVNAHLLQQLVNKKGESDKGIVASQYADTMGTPVLFDRNYFAELKELSGNEGAKKLVKLHWADAATVNFAKGAIDIDTEQDYNNLIKRQP